MAFWSSQRIEFKQKESPLINPECFNPNRIEHGAYELSVSRKCITNSLKDPRINEEFEGLCIKPGEFAVLLTNEKVFIPPDTISFISIKASIKIKGLINVSGFHVDPGFSGHLKFSVFNASSSDIIILFNEPVFLIWFADFNESVDDPYEGKHMNQDRILPADIERMGQTTSPNALLARVESVERKLNTVFWVGGVVVAWLISYVFDLI